MMESSEKLSLRGRAQVSATSLLLWRLDAMMAILILAGRLSGISSVLLSSGVLPATDNFLNLVWSLKEKLREEEAKEDVMSLWRVVFEWWEGRNKNASKSWFFDKILIFGLLWFPAPRKFRKRKSRLSYCRKTREISNSQYTAPIFGSCSYRFVQHQKTWQSSNLDF